MLKFRDHACGDVIEKVHYSVGLHGSNLQLHLLYRIDQPFTSEDYYPQCEACFSHELSKEIVFNSS